ncbi:MAG: aminotransferase class IV family protein [Armatimonadetes bacterium]|nr:aminotransferase class IV family protein [Armatimonadota bacterium]
MPEIVYLNGSLIPSDEAFVSIHDRGLLYGDGLFETMRAYRGVPFRLEEHLARMEAGSRLIRMNLPARKSLRQAVLDAVAANGIAEAYVRLTVTRGPGIGMSLSACRAPTVMVAVRPSPQTPLSGCRAVLSSHRRDEDSPLSRVKSLNYLPSLLARAEAEEAGAEEAILLNRRGSLAEGAASNLFWVCRGILYTPAVSCGILPGTVRADVLLLAAGPGIQAREGAFPPESLQDADEAFLTNSSIEIRPLLRFGEHPIGTERPGPVTLKLQTAYREMVGAR